MSEQEQDKKEAREHIDVTIGAESSKNMHHQEIQRYQEEEILKTLKEQTRYVKQIKNILLFFFWLMVATLVFAFSGGLRF